MIIAKEKEQQLLTQEVPGQRGSCDGEDNDGNDDKGQETLAGSSLPNGWSHSFNL